MKKIFHRRRRRMWAYVMLFVLIFSASMPRQSYGAAGETLSGKEELEESEQLPESMSLFSNELTLKISKDIGMIKPVFFPDKTEASVTFQSEDENIARVEEDGSVIPVSLGNTYICVSTPEGLTDYCYVNIIENDADVNKTEQEDNQISEKNINSNIDKNTEEKTELSTAEDMIDGASEGETDSISGGEAYSISEEKEGSDKTEENIPTSDSLSPDVDTVISSIRSYMLSNDTNPDYSSIWNVIGMTRSGLEVPASYIDTFYNNVYSYLTEKNWNITKTKYSDYSKLIIGLTSIGIDAQNVDGHNLLENLSDFTNVKYQGFNGPIWALIALKSHPSYQIPTNSNAKEQTTEEGLIEYLLSKETPLGGWSLTGASPDADITGMTIQALSSYYGVRDDVTQAVDRALTWLSSSQLTSGGYGTMGAETSESVAQIIVALSSISIDCGKDTRFIKNGKWPMTGLFQYYMPEGGFMHVAAGAVNNGGGEAGKLNGMATEQGMYATVAYKRYLSGKTSLYDMSDITLRKGAKPDSFQSEDGQGTNSTTSTKKDSTTTVSQKVNVIKVALNYSQITVTKGKSKTLKATVTPTNAANKKLKWTTSNKKIATVTSKGKVTGKKAGTAKITVTAQDGSKKKATCTVKVKADLTTSKSKTTVATTRSQTKTVTTAAARPTVTTASGSTSSPSSGTTVKTTGTGASGQTSTGKKEGAEETDTTEEAGWSFDGEDYIPEMQEDTEAEENTEASDIDSSYDSNLSPIPYVMMGGGGCGIIWTIWWLLRRKKIEEAEQEILKKAKKYRDDWPEDKWGY